jgi:hypothetical protein
MPVGFEGFLTVEHYHALCGFAGIVSAFVVLFIWGQGL